MELEERAESRAESSAEVFERLFLPAMAGPWAIRVADAARLVRGARVLDVACGTGAVAAEALKRVGPDGSVTGLDRSLDMLAVARRKLPNLDWHEGRAEALPFDDAVFDAVTCQFGMMFFDDPGQALREMRRVLRAGGRLALAVWDGLERTPGYAALTDLVERHLGPEAGMPIRASFALGDADKIRSLIKAAAFVDVEAASVEATARFPSIEDWVEAEVRGWVGGDFGAREYEALLDDARHMLAGYERQDGSVEFALPAIIGTASNGKQGQPAAA